MRLTITTLTVLAALRAAPPEGMYGWQITSEAGVSSGVVHPILARLEADGWVCARWEELDPAAEGRPRRHYYSIAEDSRGRVDQALEEARLRSDLRWLVGAQVVRSSYRACLPDGSLWVESGNLVEVLVRSEGHAVTFERMDVVETCTPWQAFTPE